MIKIIQNNPVTKVTGQDNVIASNQAKKILASTQYTIISLLAEIANNPRITISVTPPINPRINDLWYDLN